MNEQIIAKIKELFNSESKQVILITIGGSRAKGLASANSDYDMRVITLNKTEDYLL